MDKELIKIVMNFGKAERLIEELLEDDIFTDLSKHNEYYDHPDEIISTKLEDLRCKLRMIQDKLQEIHEIIYIDTEKEY